MIFEIAISLIIRRLRDVKLIIDDIMILETTDLHDVSNQLLAFGLDHHSCFFNSWYVIIDISFLSSNPIQECWILKEKLLSKLSVQGLVLIIWQILASSAQMIRGNLWLVLIEADGLKFWNNSLGRKSLGRIHSDWKVVNVEWAAWFRHAPIEM